MTIILALLAIPFIFVSLRVIYIMVYEKDIYSLKSKKSLMEWEVVKIKNQFSGEERYLAREKTEEGWYYLFRDVFSGEMKFTSNIDKAEYNFSADEANRFMQQRKRELGKWIIQETSRRSE